MPAKGEKIGGAESESKNYIGVYRVQACLLYTSDAADEL